MVNVNAAIVLQRRCMYKQTLALVAIEQMLGDPQAVLDEAFYDELEAHFKTVKKYGDMMDTIKTQVEAMQHAQAPPAPVETPAPVAVEVAEPEPTEVEVMEDEEAEVESD